MGYSYGDWDGEGNAGYQDFAAAIVDPDGVERWRWMVRIKLVESLE